MCCAKVGTAMRPNNSVLESRFAALGIVYKYGKYPPIAQRLVVVEGKEEVGVPFHLMIRDRLPILQEDGELHVPGCSAF